MVKPKLTTVTGALMDVEGVLNMTCELNGNSAIIRVIISKHVTDEFLISETALQKLRVISWNFPFDTVRQVKSGKCLYSSYC